MNPYEGVLSWKEDDLLNLPPAEDDYYEYKSSRIPKDKLAEDLKIDASAFGTAVEVF